MVTLLEDSKNSRAQKIFGDISEQVGTLKTQHGQAKSALKTIKVEITELVAAGNWDIDKHSQLVSANTRLTGIISKFIKIKTALGTIKGDLTDPEHQTELQSLVDGINE